MDREEGRSKAAGLAGPTWQNPPKGTFFNYERACFTRRAQKGSFKTYIDHMFKKNAASVTLESEAL
jgi:hypothetical protein